MTVKELIMQLLDYGLDQEVFYEQCGNEFTQGDAVSVSTLYTDADGDPMLAFARKAVL